MNKIFFIIVFVIILNLIISKIYINHYIKNNYPPNILFPVKDDIELPDIKKGTDIPKYIYRTCNNYDISKFKKSLDKTQEIMSDYNQIIYTDDMIEEFIKEHYSTRIWNAYDSLHPDFFPAKADLFRYLLIYYKGGIYLDIKSSIIKDIRPILHQNGDKLLISHWLNFKAGLLKMRHIDNSYNYTEVNNDYGEYQNWHIISPKGNPILKKIIEQVISNIENGLLNKDIYSKGKTSIISCTGPIMYSLVIQKYYNDKDIYKFSKNINDTLMYKYVDHKKAMGKNHYIKKGNKCIFK